MTTVRELFESAGVHYSGAVPWGVELPQTAPGVYVVSTTENPDDGDGVAGCPLESAAVASLLLVRPEATIDGRPVDAQQVADRLRSMWPAGEPVVYIGLAGTSIRHRVHQFYATRIGARAPHAGGWPVKMLDPSQLWVHFGATNSPASAEAAMVHHFVDGVRGDVRHSLIDPTAPLPFANLTFPGGRRKRHGFQGVKAPVGESVDRSHAVVDLLDVGAHAGARIESPGPTLESGRTQNVTEADLAAGHIRVPRVSKSLFPASRTEIWVEVGNESLSASWDPRTAGDKERSGVIRFGRGVLTPRMSVGAQRTIERSANGYRIS